MPKQTADADYESYRRGVFDFLWREVEPMAAEIERSGEFPTETLFPKFRQHGLFGPFLLQGNRMIGD